MGSGKPKASPGITLAWAAKTALLTAIVAVFTVSQASMAAFNDRVTGARAQGMGGAFTAVADDTSALYWNPAGMYQIKRHEATFMYADKYDMTVGPAFMEQYFAYSSPVTDYGTFGFHFNKEGSDSVLSEKTLGLSYGKKVGSLFSFGFNVNSLTLSPSINSTQRDTRDPALSEQSSMAFDLGMLLEIGRKAKVGMSVRNLGASFGVLREHHLDTEIKLGTAVQTSDRLLLALDLNFKENIEENKDNSFQLSLGGEYRFTDQFLFRAGFNKGDISAGVGFQSADWALDYAFMNHEIGNTHRVSFSMRFGEEAQGSDGTSGNGSGGAATVPANVAYSDTAAPSSANHLRTRDTMDSSAGASGGGLKAMASGDSTGGSLKGMASSGSSGSLKGMASSDSTSGGGLKAMASSAPPASSGNLREAAGTASSASSAAAAPARVVDTGEDLRDWKPLPKRLTRNRQKINPRDIPRAGGDDSPYVSLKFLADRLKYHYSYNPTEGTVSLFKLGILGKDTFIRMKVGSREYEKNRQKMNLSAPVKLVGRDVAAPLDEVAELLGAEVGAE